MNLRLTKGIHHELTVPHFPEHNGVAERMNRTLMACSMMTCVGLSDRHWAKAVDAASYIRNHTSISSIKGFKTPCEVWSGEKPNIVHLKASGCIAYSYILDSQRQKLDKKAVKLRFIGYCIQSKGYMLLDEKTSTAFYLQRCDLQWARFWTQIIRNILSRSKGWNWITCRKWARNWT